MALIDSEQRVRATNPTASFIVQAPAGSGKTEILTQRYLRLLSTVTAPEQIVALTFTRKAASEMRERIVLALQQAAQKIPATSAHQQATLSFAQQALDHSQKHRWDLLQQPNRLRIITIDSLCQSINQAIPLMERQVVYSAITDKPERYYLKAARQCIQYALDTPEFQTEIKTLLVHVDNKRERLLHLFKELLAKRDQWLLPLFLARTQDKSVFEEALHSIEQHELMRFKKSLPPLLAAELTALAREMSVIENNPQSARYVLRDWYDFDDVTPEIATGLSKLVLTGDLNVRTAFDHHVGLKKSDCSAEEYERLKTGSKSLLAQLNDYPDFINALIQVSTLPHPEYDPKQWLVLQALFQLLPLLVGHLLLLFSEHNEVDFTAISQQALQALGDEENPTDLALYLDNSIHHLLVDEFQDTSITQFELLSKLVRGWQANDGKTLFVVGDPMQSIYRFRQAEVGLFFRAQEQGIGGVALTSLELRCNFRSTQSIVSWVNQHFASVFPKEFDMESGAVSFHASTHVIEDQESRPAVQALHFKGKEQEAEHLVQLIQYELEQQPTQSIAILVRSRSQLVDIIRLLRQHQIPYQGTDIDLLAHLMHLRDVWSLTQALLLPANRLSWLALLRSPYCGLCLADLHCIAAYNKKKSIYYALHHLDSMNELSAEGKVRAGYFFAVMQQALTQRFQHKLSIWVGQTLKNLHVDKILNRNQLLDIQQFWELLDRYEQAGHLPDLGEFELELQRLYSQQSIASSVQVMTIHKSKGLEFDTVILPGLGSQPSRGDNPLLRWLKLPTQNNEDLLLVSPIQAADQDHCPLYDYLGQLDDEKSQYEMQRILYVAVTRAKKNLYLLDCASKSSKSSFRALLKHQEFKDVDAIDATEQELTLPQLTQLPLSYYLQFPSQVPSPLNPPSTGFHSEIPRLCGIVAHLLLQWICDHHPTTFEEIPWQLALHEYRQLGFDEALQQHSLNTLQQQLKQLFHDPIGQWIIAAHPHEKNEYELLVQRNHQIVTRIIDRTFEHDSKLWIIDFKTGKEEEHSVAQHQRQLNEYSEHLSHRTELPIHCGLYYLANAHWIAWQPQFAAELA